MTIVFVCLKTITVLLHLLTYCFLGYVNAAVAIIVFAPQKTQKPASTGHHLPRLRPKSIMRSCLNKCHTGLKSHRMPVMWFILTTASLGILTQYSFHATQPPWPIILLSQCLILSYIDWHQLMAPRRLTYLLIWSGLGIQWLYNPTCVEPLVSALFGYMMLWSARTVYALLKKREGLGLGDCKVMAGLGAWFHWNQLPQILLLACLYALTIQVMCRCKRLPPQNAPKILIPFVPYLSLGALTTLWFPQLTF